MKWLRVGEKFILSISQKRFNYSLYVLPIACFVLQYSFTCFRGGFSFYWVEELHQSLGVQALSLDPFHSLLNNHIQPPGLNLIFAVALQLPLSKWLLQSFFFLVTLFTILMVTECSRLISSSKRIGIALGIIYSLLPTTVLYSLYPYNQSLVAFGFALASLGLAKAKTRSRFSEFFWCLGLLVVFLVRPSMIWILAIFIGLLPFVIRVLNFKKIAVFFVVLFIPVCGIQAFYFYKFGLTSTSSWSSMNRIDALVNSGVISKAELERSVSGDTCLESLISAQRDPDTGGYDFWGDIKSLDSSCFIGKTRFEPGKYLVEGTKGPTKFPYYKNIQRNTAERLMLSRHWDRLANNLFRQEPLAPLQMAIGSNGSTSSFEVLIRPGYSFLFLADNLWAGAPLNMFFRPIGAVFPAGSIFFSLGVIGILFFWRLRGKNGVYSTEILILNTILFVWIAISTLASIGENARHLVEVYPLLIINMAFLSHFFSLRPHTNLQVERTKT